MNTCFTDLAYHIKMPPLLDARTKRVCHTLKSYPCLVKGEGGRKGGIEGGEHTNALPFNNVKQNLRQTKQDSRAIISFCRADNAFLTCNPYSSRLLQPYIAPCPRVYSWGDGGVEIAVYCEDNTRGLDLYL